MFEDLIPSAAGATPAPPPGLFDDLIPAAAGETSAPPPGLFDDLIPAGGDANAAPEAAGTKEQTSIANESSAPSRASPKPGLFDDLIPTASTASGTAEGASDENEPSIGSVLKQFAIGVPEGAINMAGAVNDVMTMRPEQHAIMRALFGEQEADKFAPSMSKLLHDALPSVLNPQNYPPHNLTERVARGVGEGMPAVAIPGGTIAGRVLTQGLAGATGALAAEAVPEPYKDTAQLLGNLVGAGIPALRSAVVDAIKRVGIAPERIDPADIDGVARSVTRRDLLNLNAFKRQVTGDALERGFVTPEELEQTYGKGTADEYRGSSTPENGAAPPPQGAERGGPGSLSPEGQQLHGPGENGGRSREPTRASAEAVPSTEPKPGDAERGTSAEPPGPNERAASRAADSSTPPNASGPEEAVRSSEVTPDGLGKEAGLHQQGDATSAALAPRARILSGKLGGARIEAPAQLFDWIGMERGEFFANFEYLKQKHPEYFTTPRDARNHVLDVLTDADFAIHQKRGAVVLVARDGDDQLIAFDAQKKQGRYVIVTAYRLNSDQFDRMLRGAERGGELTVRRYSTSP
jgi:hypothetical protein